jgi:hypothetical protein
MPHSLSAAFIVLLTSMALQQLLVAGPLKSRADSHVRALWQRSREADRRGGDLRPVSRGDFDTGDQQTVEAAERKKTTTKRNVGVELNL